MTNTFEDPVLDEPAAKVEDQERHLNKAAPPGRGYGRGNFIVSCLYRVGK